MTLDSSEEKRIREIIEYQVKQLDAIYKITCPPKDYAEWKSPGLSEGELREIEARLGMRLPEEQRIALGVFEFRISPTHELDAGFSDGFVPVNNMCLAEGIIHAQLKLMRSLHDGGRHEEALQSTQIGRASCRERV